MSEILLDSYDAERDAQLKATLALAIKSINLAVSNQELSVLPTGEIDAYQPDLAKNTPKPFVSAEKIQYARNVLPFFTSEESEIAVKSLFFHMSPMGIVRSSLCNLTSDEQVSATWNRIMNTYPRERNSFHNRLGSRVFMRQDDWLNYSQTTIVPIRNLAEVNLATEQRSALTGRKPHLITISEQGRVKADNEPVKFNNEKRLLNVLLRDYGTDGTTIEDVVYAIHKNEVRFADTQRNDPGAFKKYLFKIYETKIRKLIVQFEERGIVKYDPRRTDTVSLDLSIISDRRSYNRTTSEEVQESAPAGPVIESPTSVYNVEEVCELLDLNRKSVNSLKRALHIAGERITNDDVEAMRAIIRARKQSA